MLKMTGKGGTGQACAACKYQRRKCSPDCPLAPYFPPDQPKLFLNAHKLFGVSNILRILRQVDESQKSDAMKSIIYEANAREKDPVHGCFGIIVMLQTRVERLREELELVRSQTMFVEQIYQNGAGCATANAAANATGRDVYAFQSAQAQAQAQAQQQQQQQLQSLAAGGGMGVSHAATALPASWICSCAPSPTPSPSPSPYGNYDGHGIYRQCYDSRPNKLMEYEQRQAYSDSREAYESSNIGIVNPTPALQSFQQLWHIKPHTSAESSLKESQSLEHVAEHELKSAAALFTLTNQH